MKNKTHLNMPGFKLPHMGGEKQVGPYKSALHFDHDKVNPFAPEEKVPSFQDTFMKGGLAGAGVGLVIISISSKSRLYPFICGLRMFIPVLRHL